MPRLAFLITLFIASGFAVAQQPVGPDQPQQPVGPTSPPPGEEHDLQYYNSLKEPEVPWYFEPAIESGISYLVFGQAKNNAFYTRTGAYVDGNFNFNPPGLHLPFILGAGVTAAGFWDTDSFLGVENLYSTVGLFSLEGRISYPIYFFPEQDGGPFLMPRLGIGGLYNYYDIQEPFGVSAYHNGGGFEVRPAIEFGYRWGQASVGLNISYMVAWGSFGDFGSTAQDVQGGFLFAYRF